MSDQNLNPSLESPRPLITLRQSVNLSCSYRAVVEPADWRHAARHAFVEACSHNAALRKIATAVGALECLPEGRGKDIGARPFETGWSAGTVTYVQQPLFLLDEPATLIRLWARCTL
jgi:hypothetical protein